MTGRRSNGEGSINQRTDGRWQAVYTDNSKKRYIYGKTRQEVADKLTETLYSKMIGTYRAPNKLTMENWLTVWLTDYVQPSVRVTTFEAYQVQVQKHIIPSIGNIMLSKLQTGHLQRLYNDLLIRGRSDGKGGLSPASVRYVHTVLFAALSQAKKEMLILINPAEAVRLPKVQKKEMQTLDTASLKTFLDEARRTNYFTLYLVEISTGLRRGELLGLRWQDIDLQGGSIAVTQNLVRTSAGLTIQPPKTKLSRRTVSIGADVVRELKSHRARQAQSKLLKGDSYIDTGLVFCSSTGRPVDPRGVSRHFERLCIRAGLEGLTFHSLRHSYAALCLQEGVSIKAVQENLGHGCASFTMSTYGHCTGQMRQEATTKIGSLITSVINI